MTTPGERFKDNVPVTLPVKMNASLKDLLMVKAVVRSPYLKARHYPGLTDSACRISEVDLELGALGRARRVIHASTEVYVELFTEGYELDERDEDFFDVVLPLAELAVRDY